MLLANTLKEHASLLFKEYLIKKNLILNLIACKLS